MFNLPKYITDFLNVFKKNGFEIYIVGGAVRHLILEKETDNWDFACNAKPDEILKLFPDGYYNNKYGTVTIPVEIEKGKKLLFEVTPYRKESDYKNYRHPEKIEWADTISKDLARRDFTINAMAYDGHHIIDPYNGKQDLEKKLIVAVGDPDKRFSEDALRLMRGIRQASQMGFLIEEKTRNSIKKNAKLIKNISWERIRDELMKIMESDSPSEGILFLKNSGLLKYILPELDACFAIPQVSPERHHIYDAGTHSIMSLKYCPSKDPITRLATLLHDIGKVETYKKDEKTKIITFYNHEVVGTKLVQEIANRLRLSNKQKKQLITLVKYHQFTISELQTDKAVRRFIKQVGKENIEHMLDLRIGDRIGSGAKPTSWRFELFKKRIIEVQKEPFKISDLKISGNDVMKILKLKQGPEIGKTLKQIFEEVIDGKIKNEREILLDKIKSFSN